MKFIDKNGKLFNKISVIDTIVIFAVIFMLFSLLSRFFVKTEFNNLVNITVGRHEVQYTVDLKVYGIYNTEVSPFKVGDNIYGYDGEIIGKVTECEKKASVVKIKLADGTYVDRESVEYVEYFLTIQGNGTESDKGVFSAGTLALIPGNHVGISTRLFTGTAAVLSIEKKI